MREQNTIHIGRAGRIILAEDRKTLPSPRRRQVAQHRRIAIALIPQVMLHVIAPTAQRHLLLAAGCDEEHENGDRSCASHYFFSTGTPFCSTPTTSARLCKVATSSGV